MKCHSVSAPIESIWGQWLQCVHPPWIVSAADCLFNKERRGAFLSVMLGKLTPAAAELLKLESPQIQFHILSSLLISRRDWNDPDSYVRQCIVTFRMLTGGGEVGHVPAQMSVPSVTFKLAVVHNCVGMGTSHLVLMGALAHIKKKYPRNNFELVCNTSFEVNPDCRKLELALCQHLQVAVEQRGDVHHVPELMLEKADQWRSQNVKVIFLNSWPCKDTSKANTKSRQPGSGLHMQNSRAMWPIVTAMAHLNGMLEHEDFLHITEYPECRFKEEDDKINEYFGPPVVVSTCLLYTSPSPRDS